MARNLKASSLAGVVVLVLSVFFGVPARAATITLWPDQFKPSMGGLTIEQSAERLQGHDWYQAVVKLPVGAKVKGFKVNYSTDGDPDWAYGICLRLARQTMGTNGSENIIDWSFREDGEGNFIAESPVEAIVGPAKVAAGYRYFVSFEPGNAGWMYSVQLNYTAP